MTTKPANFILVLLLACAQLALASVSAAAVISPIHAGAPVLSTADSPTPGNAGAPVGTITTAICSYDRQALTGARDSVEPHAVFVAYRYDAPLSEVEIAQIHWYDRPTLPAGANTAIPQLLPRPPPTDVSTANRGSQSGPSQSGPGFLWGQAPKTGGRTCEWGHGKISQSGPGFLKPIGAKPIGARLFMGADCGRQRRNGLAQAKPIGANRGGANRGQAFYGGGLRKATQKWARKLLRSFCGAEDGPVTVRSGHFRGFAGAGDGGDAHFFDVNFGITWSATGPLPKQ